MNSNHVFARPVFNPKEHCIRAGLLATWLPRSLTFAPIAVSIVFLWAFLPIHAFSTPIRWEVAAGGNGHLYDAILTLPGITWSDANAAAQAMGNGWHLATITSAEENNFIFGLISGDERFWNCCLTSNLVGRVSNGPWIGGFRAGARWAWVTGEPFAYSNWGPFEPFGNGNRITFSGFGAAIGRRWNDVPDSYRALPPVAFIIETPQAVPEASSLMLVLLGLVTTLAIRTRPKKH